MATTLLAGLFIVALGYATADIPLRHSKILDKLRVNSDPDVIPLSLDNDLALDVYLELSLLSVVDVVEDKNIVDLLFHLKQKYRNNATIWDHTDPEMSAENVTIPTRLIWIPDITPLPAVEEMDSLSPDLAVICFEGSVRFEQLVSVSLKADLSQLKTTGAVIKFRLQSFAYDSSQLTLTASTFSSDNYDGIKYQVSDLTVSKQDEPSINYSRFFDVVEYSLTLKQT